MTHKGTVTKAQLLSASVLLFAATTSVLAVDVSVVSDSNDAWSVSETRLDNMGQPVTTELGKPQTFCLNSSSTPPVPASCPTTAMPPPTSYGYNLGGWAANLSVFPPGAKWIWANKKSDGSLITGATTGAGGAEYSFKTKFFLCGMRPRDGAIWVAADDSVEVFVNGAPMPVLRWNGHASAGTAMIPAASLRTAPNPNIIELKVKNFASAAECPNDQYQCNPAGLVFGATFGDELSANPMCSNPPGNIGDKRTLGACAPSQIGAKESACICLGSVAAWFDYDTCVALPPACTAYAYSEWSACDTDGRQTRTVTGKIPAGCAGSPPAEAVLTQSCTYVPPACTAFTYSAWGQCQPDGTQSRTVLASIPAGCTGGTPVTTQSCAFVPPQVGVGERCGASNITPSVFASCPSGTTCGPRTSGGYKPPAWCVACGIFTLGICLLSDTCRATPPLRTTDWFCD